jgi:6-phosphofructokinase 1
MSESEGAPAGLPPDLPLPAETAVARVGTASVPSPLRSVRFTDDSRGVLVSSNSGKLAPYLEAGLTPPAFEEAGPRHALFCDPATAVAGIVTCGGLCPGLNDVIRAITLTCLRPYGMAKVLGYRYGYAGLTPSGEPPLELDAHVVDRIHEHGGTILGSSRGPQEPAVMVDTLVADGVRVLFCVGGDGTLRGASAIAAEIARRGLEIAVVGIPKTIDNDLSWVVRSFGFATAVEEAAKALAAANTEATGAWNGVGIVKLMGRHSGFIAAHATLASYDVNLCLVPEVPFTLHGAGGVCDLVARRLAERHHAVIAVAEGAGQDLLADPALGKDKSGNARLADVGTFLRDALADHLKAIGMDHTVKYIDPSYLIRSLPANAFDSEYCGVLGQHAVHAALAGCTDMVVGFWHNHFTHLPIALATGERLRLDPERDVWQRVLQATGQPASLVGA